ncbi:MAG: class I SAM-dependent methyltransferase, partial [Leeuwenhoekiella sp.]
YELFFFRKDKDSETLGKEYFDKLYHKSDDPWNFTDSRYEQEKYKQTLSVLDDRYDRVLELGCSIGILSAHLAEKCNYLTAIDISELPLESARKRCAKFSHVNFLKMDISKNFPDEGYDLILISEVGYYLNRKNLDKLFKNCSRHLNKNGHLLMVHYTSFVSEYPLSGKEVHDYFLQSVYANNFKQKDFQVHTGYELVLWEKAS